MLTGGGLMKVWTVCVALLGTVVLTFALPADAYEKFWDHWGDGRAELASYDLEIQRYGETRSGTAVAIFVTETFANSLRVKSDPGRRSADDEFPVMKLNLVQDFSTGIYDYNLMTSVFVALEPVNGRPAGTATKVTFSSQEWCGQVWHQLLFDADRIREELFSYFDGEADQSRVLEFPVGGMSEDELLLWARGLAGPDVMPGGPVTVPLLRSLEWARLRHQELEWSTVELKVADEAREITVPAGTFVAREHTARIAGGPTWKFEIEDRFPYRLLAWQTDDGKRAVLRGVERLKYWELNGEDDEAALEKIGLD
jgi:hypothetical protein